MPDPYDAAYRQREAVYLLIIAGAGLAFLASCWLPPLPCYAASLLILLLVHPYLRWQERRIPRNVSRTLDGRDPGEIQAASERHR